MKPLALNLLDQDPEKARNGFLALDPDTRGKLVRWVLSCAQPGAESDPDPDKQAFLALVTQGNNDAQETPHEIIEPLASSLPFPEKESLRRHLRHNDKTLYREIGHWRWLAFADLPCFSDRTTQHWLREVYSDDLVKVLRADADGALSNKVLPNLSSMARELMEKDIAKEPPTPPRKSCNRRA